MDNDTCAFCAIAHRRAPAKIVRRWDSVVAIRPRSGGVTAGHLLVIPHQHVPDVGTDPTVTAAVFAAAAELAALLPACNVLTSKGRDGTQSVPHLHAHVVPQNAFDGLLLPWSACPDAELAGAA